MLLTVGFTQGPIPPGNSSTLVVLKCHRHQNGRPGQVLWRLTRR